VAFWARALVRGERGGTEWAVAALLAGTAAAWWVLPGGEPPRRHPLGTEELVLAALGFAGAVFTWAGGFADRRFGPKPVIAGSVIALTLICCIIVGMTREALWGIPFPPGSGAADAIFYGCGVAIGAGGGILQAASRGMMVRQADPSRMTEAFGLYALAGKATTFVAPAAIALATDLTGDQRMGIAPLIGLFLLALGLLVWVKPDGERPAP